MPAKPPPPDPDFLEGKILRRVVELEAKFDELHEQLAAADQTHSAADETHTEQIFALQTQIGEVRRDIAEVKATIGEAPDDLTGQGGSGLAGLVIDLVRQRRRETAAYAFGGASGAYTFIELGPLLVRALVRLFGGDA